MSPHSLTKSPAFKRLKQLHDQPGKRDLLWYHQVGQQVDALHPSESREYGESRIQEIADALGEKASYGDKLWKARNFFEKYTRDEAKALNRPDPDSGYVLTWSHMVHLLSLDDFDRLWFEEDCLNAEWSTRELRQAIADDRGRKGKGGRRFQNPSNTEAALRQLIRESQMWHRRYQEVWFGVEDPAIEFEGRKRLTADIRKVVDEAVESLKILRHDIDQSLKILNTVLKVKKKPSRKKK